nr:hypothetical protein [Agromyces archimandritae]
MNSTGRVTRTIGIPGTGISNVKSIGSSSRRRSAARRSGAPARGSSAKAAHAQTPKPGLFAPVWEKVAYRAVGSPAPDVAELRYLAQESPTGAPTLSLVEAVFVNLPAGDMPRARSLLAWLHARGVDPHQERFVRSYLSEKTLTVGIANGITAVLGLDRNALGLILAELHQSLGYVDDAIAVVEELEPSTLTAVSLAELYAQQGRWGEIVELTDGVTNVDEPSMFLLVQRGAALREQGYHEAARETLEEALRLRSRPVGLRNLAYVERGRVHMQEGKRSLARKDFERVLAADASFPGLAGLLAQAE